MLWAIGGLAIMMWLMGFVTGAHALLVAILVAALAMINAAEAKSRLKRSRARVNSQKISA